VHVKDQAQVVDDKPSTVADAEYGGDLSTQEHRANTPNPLIPFHLSSELLQVDHASTASAHSCETVGLHILASRDLAAIAGRASFGGMIPPVARSGNLKTSR
jgi:hypothetical protein